MTEVRITRRFAAPRQLVFEAWTDPEQVAKWWAPEGFEVPRGTVVVEPRVGGRIHFSMVALAGASEYPVRFEIVEITEPELLVLTADPMPEEGIPHPTVTRVVFEEEEHGTRVTVTSGPHTVELLPSAQAGWSGCLDKLEALLDA
jgi:uncharacterized protein YndB with AHSA1/START domain